MTGIENVWEWPLRVHRPQLTGFNSGRIYNLAYAPERHRLFPATGHAPATSC